MIFHWGEPVIPKEMTNSRSEEMYKMNMEHKIIQKARLWESFKKDSGAVVGFMVQNDISRS